MERGAAVQPMWQGVSLIVDEFTRAAYGEIIVHAVLLPQFRHHAQGAILETPNAARLGPWRKLLKGRTAKVFAAPVELRESESSGPMLHGVLIQEGRAASVRAEVFSPLSLVWAE